MTAIANDYGFEETFRRIVQANLEKNDLLICLSTSGKSQNILNGIKAASDIGIKCVLWMGEYDVPFENIEVWQVKSRITPRIQEIHLSWGHLIAELIEYY